MAPAPHRRLMLPLAVLLLAACSSDKQDATTAAATPSLAVTLAPAQSASLQRSVLASGPVAAWEEMQLGVELSGLRVTALHVDVGQHVAKGQLLLELDHRTLDSELRQANEILRKASAYFAQAELDRRVKP